MSMEISRIHIRTITFIGAGAAILAVIGYFFIRSDRKKVRPKSYDTVINEEAKRRSSRSNIEQINTSENIIYEENNLVELISDDKISASPSCEVFLNQVENAENINLIVSDIQSDLLAKNKDDQLFNKPEANLAEIKNEENLITANESENLKIEISNEFSYETVLKIEPDKESFKINELLNKELNVQENLKNLSIDSDTSSDSGNGLSNVEGDMVHLSNSNDYEEENKIMKQENEIIINELSEKTNEEIYYLSRNENYDNTEIEKSKNEITKSETMELLKNEQLVQKKIKNRTKKNLNEIGNVDSERNNLKTSVLSSSSSTSFSSSTRNTPKKSNKNPQNQADSFKSSTNSLSNAKVNKISKETKNKKISSNNNDNSDFAVYEFNFPRKYCGKLIGKGGVHVDFIRSKTNTQIAVRNENQSDEFQVVCVSGRIKDVDIALDLISERFPSNQYPNISFKPISKPIVYRCMSKEKTPFNESPKVLVASTMYVDLAEVVQNSKNENDSNQINLFDVHVTSFINTTQVFIQLPTHSSYKNLQKLDENMKNVYQKNLDLIPGLIEPIENGNICAAPTFYGWHRAIIVNYQSKKECLQLNSNYSEDCGQAELKFLDYGGYLTLSVNQLRQLRSDFMLLPFQGIECYLNGIYPFEGTEEEGRNYLANLIKNKPLKASLIGYCEDGTPEIKLYFTNELFQNICVNDELLKAGYVFSTNYENSNNIIDQDRLKDSQRINPSDSNFNNPSLPCCSSITDSKNNDFFHKNKFES